jgi:hypothetical protein
MKRINGYLVAALIACQMLFAGNENVGTVSGVQLLLPVGARSVGMSGAVQSTVSGLEAAYWNPAGVAKVKTASFYFNQMNYIADIKVNNIAGAYAIDGIGTFGAHVQFLDFGDIEQTTTDMPDGTGITYSPDFLVGGISFARAITDKVNAGVTLKYVYEGIMETSASAFAFDIGVQYKFNNGLRFGISMKNIGTKMLYDGDNLEQQIRIDGSSPSSDNGYARYSTLEFGLPTTFALGMSYDYSIDRENLVTLAGDFVHQNEGDSEYYLGAEYSYDRMFYLRAGYNATKFINEDILFGFTAGGAVNIVMGGTKFEIGYAFRSVENYFDHNNMFTIALDI